MSKNIKTVVIGVCLLPLAGFVVWRFLPSKAPERNVVQTEAPEKTQPTAASNLSQPRGELRADSTADGPNNAHDHLPAAVLSPVVEESKRIDSRPPPKVSGEILALAAQLAATKDSEKRKEIMADLLGRMTAGNAQGIRKLIGPLSPRDPASRAYHHMLGAYLGEKALMDPDMNPRSLRPLLSGWAAKDPDAASAWLNNLNMSDHPVLGDLVHSGTSEERLESFLNQGLLEGLLEHDYDQALAMIYDAGTESWNEGNTLMRTATEWATTDMTRDEELTWVEGLPEGPMRGSAAGMIIEDWGNEDAITSLQWALSMEDPETRGSALSAAFAKWATGAGGGNPEVGTEMLNNLESQRDRDFALNGYASGVVGQDPERAIALAESIETEGLRNAALARITRQAEAILARQNEANAAEPEE